MQMLQADQINVEERSEKPLGEMDASVGLSQGEGAAPTACCTDVVHLNSH